MITIFAEKPNIGRKIAAALDKITLDNGTIVNFEQLNKMERQIKAQQAKDGFLKIYYMGQECYVTWGYGHICELKQATDYNPEYRNWSKMPMPFIPNKYETKAKETTIKQFNLVKNLMNKSSLIINATDFDREGDLIFAYVYEVANVKVPFKRVCFSSTEKNEFIDKFKSLKEAKDVKSITDAGIGRSIADFVVGANLTTQMTLKTGSKNVLSVGRVQTPTLNILVEREEAIRNFVPTPYYTINAIFTTDKGESYKADYKKKKIVDKKEAEDIFNKINKNQGIVSDIDKKIEFKEGPNLYNLSSLQMVANSKYGFTMDKTLDLAQKLYEGGYTTYPRTDSQFLTEDMEPTINSILDVLSINNSTYKKFIDGKPRKFVKSKYFDDKKVQSHFAIIPTTTYPSTLPDDQQKLYDLIARSVITMLYGKAKLENTKVTTKVLDEEFISNGKMVVDPQWMAIDSMTKDVIIPTLEKDQIVDGKYTLNTKMTQPPKRYTDKTLLNAMLNSGKELDDIELKKIMSSGKVKGIGTEATRAKIVETLIIRGYATRDKKNIYATDKGIQLIHAIPINEIKSAELTALWEKRLKEIELGKEDLNKFIKDIEDTTRRWVVELDKTVERSSVSSVPIIGVCPNCGKNIIKMKWGYGCTGYKEGCKFTISNEIAHKKITEAQVKKLLEKGKTNEIKGFKSAVGKSFNACLKLDKDNKIVFDFATKTLSTEPSKIKLFCPKCKKELEKTPWSFKCSCGITFSRKICDREIKEKEIKDLIDNHITKKLSGFKSKANKPFSAYLELQDDYTVKFKFD